MTAYDDFFQRQLRQWPLAQENYQSQAQASYRDVHYSDCCRIRLVCLPKRIGSSSAKLTAKGEVNRPCFLCAHRLPPEQISLPYGEFSLLVNPFPVFPQHFTLAFSAHRRQSLEGHWPVLFQLAEDMTDFVVFFNGSLCGASAPDHLHFQAGSKGLIPIQTDYPKWRTKACVELHREKNWSWFRLDNMLRNAWLLEGSCSKELIRCCQQISQQLGQCLQSEGDQHLNVLMWRENEQFVCLLFPRQCHRPSCFFAEGEAQRITSPASVEMGGYYIFPRESDFERTTPDELAQIYAEVSLDLPRMKDIESSILPLLNHSAR